MPGRDYAIATETSSRRGGVAVGRGDEILACDEFTAAGTYASQLIPRMERLLAGQNIRPSDVSAVYVSIGPGGFTGLRMGITVARTLAWAMPDMRCVAVPTSLVVAQNVRDLEWENLAIIFDAGPGRVYVQSCKRQGGQIVLSGDPIVTSPEEFLAEADMPMLLAGPATADHDLVADGVTVAPDDAHLPTVAGLWRAGVELHAAGEFTDYNRCLPIYARRPGITKPRK